MIGLKTEIGRGFASKFQTATGKAGIDAVEQLIAPNAAGALGTSVRQRVQELGTIGLAGQTVHPYDDRYKPFLVSARYPDHVTGDKHWSGAERFKTSADYHAAAHVKLGTFSVTGGMWSGLSRVITSARRTDILFRGRSDGQNARIRNKKSRPIKESNALKAWTVLSQSGVNVLAITEEDLAAIALGSTYTMAAGIGTMLPVQWEGAPPPTDIEGIFLRAFRVARYIPVGAPGSA